MAKIPNNTDACVNCAFSRSKETHNFNPQEKLPDSLYCRRYPPDAVTIAVAQPDGMAIGVEYIIKIVSADYVCGEHTNKIMD